MKANEAPKKIWIDPTNDLPKLSGHIDKDSVEYVCEDTFIEKAAIWFNNNFVVHDEFSVMSDSFNTKEEMFDEFRKYMKGE